MKHILDPVNSKTIDLEYSPFDYIEIHYALELIEEGIRQTDNPIIVIFIGVRVYQLFRSAGWGESIRINKHEYSVVLDVNIPDDILYMLTLFKDKENMYDPSISSQYSFETGRFMGFKIYHPELQGKIINIGEIK